MFQGFNESTLKYYAAVRKDNSRKTHKENEILYLEGVKYPLEELYFELYHYFSGYDRDLLSNKRKCISSAYNDARFSSGMPIKEYFYIRFKLDGLNKKNALGFFFDASLDGYKYGLDIYLPDAKGMGKIRDYLLSHKRTAKKVIKGYRETGLLNVQGEKYKRAHYQEEDSALRDWLEYKTLSFVREEDLSVVFYEREILKCILAAFDSVKEVYFMLKRAL